MSVQLKRPSSIDVLHALFPKIEDSLLLVVFKISLEYETFMERKGIKTMITANQFFKRSPRYITGYKTAVKRFVDFGKYSVIEAIDLLLRFLPNQSQNDLYVKFVMKTTNNHVNNDIMNDLITLFFADCVAQLLTKEDDIACYDRIISLGYNLLKTSPNPFREHLRLMIVRQFSVIFSYLSIKHLDTFISRFESSLATNDAESCFIIHRFLRLTPSPTVSLGSIESFFDIWLNYAKNTKKGSVGLQNAWAEALSYLTAQIKTEGLENLSRIFGEIYQYVTTKKKDSGTHITHYTLAAILLMRDNNLLDNDYQAFVDKFVILKAKDYPEASLNAFLMILRGSYLSRSSMFWEWGDYHNNARLGIEASHIYAPEQPQENNPNSFTNFLFEHFLTLPGIEKYTQKLGDILVNLAARDLSFFARDTMPAYIQKLGINSLHSLSEALVQILAPEYHFDEWISDTVFNQGKKFKGMIREVVTIIKPQLFIFIDMMKEIGKVDSAYWFELVEQFNTPEFVLPASTMKSSANLPHRIVESTETIKPILKEWNFEEKQCDLKIDIKEHSFEYITNEEMSHIRILKFFPEIITYNDFQTQSFSKKMKDYIISSSIGVGLFAIKMLAHLYSVNATFRLPILNTILDWLTTTTVPHHIFLFLELFIKIFDLSLKPAAPPVPGAIETEVKDCPVSLIQEFADRAQATCIYLFAFPYPEIRDLAIAAIERLSKYGNSLKVAIPLEKILTENDSLIGTAVAYKVMSYESNALPVKPDIPAQKISVRTAASSRYNRFFTYYIPEIITSLSHKVSPVIVQTLVRIAINGMELVGSNIHKLSGLELLLYQNLAIILSNSVTTVDATMYKLLVEQFPLEMASFYNFSITSNLSDSQVRVKLTPYVQKAADTMFGLLEIISNEKTTAADCEKLIKCFSMTRWQMAAAFAPQLLEWSSSSSCISNANLISALKILGCFAQNPDFKFALSAQPVYLTLFISLVNNALRISTCEGTSENEILSKPIIRDLVDACLNTIFYFVTAITINPEEVSQGAFRIPKDYSWANDFAASGISIIKFCEKVSLIRSSNNPEIASLGMKATRCIASIIAASSVLREMDKDDVQRCLPYCIESESLGWPTLHFALHRNFKHLITTYITHCYSTSVSTSHIFFQALCAVLIPDSSRIIDKTKKRKKVEDKRTQMIISTMMFTLYSSTSVNAEEVGDDKLTPYELLYNQNILNACGKIFFVALIYLMDDDFDMRSSAFSLIMRLVPFVLSVVEAHDPVKPGEAVKKLARHSALFHSSIMPIPPAIIRSISGIIAQYVPHFSEQIIQEAIKCLKVTNSTSIAYNINQRVVIDMIINCLNNIQLTNQKVYCDIPTKFSVYTPYTLLVELVKLHKFINYSARTSYLSIWSKIINSKEDAERVVDFLLVMANNIELSTSIQLILLHISKTYTDIVINSLMTRLSFSFWYYKSIQLALAEKRKPEFSMNTLNTILATLIELEQVIPQQTFPYIHLMLNFSLIYYDYSPSLCRTLLFIIASSLGTCPDSIKNVFLPPGLLTWNNEKANNTSEANNLIYATTVVKRIIKFFKSQKATHPLKLWGKEAAAWACGCGDLKIASRSAEIFSCLLKPFNESMIAALITNINLVAKCQQTTASTEYLISVMNLLSSIIDKYQKNKGFAEPFKHIFNTATELVKFIGNQPLARASLTIVAKYIMNGQTTYQQMKDLVATFTNLMANIKDRRTVDGAFMSCLNMNLPPEDTSGTPIEIITLIAYIPRIYTALASCHNIEPYLTEMEEIEARRVLQCALLIANKNFVPIQLSIYFSQALSKPSTTTLEEFALKCAAHLTQEGIQPIIDAAPLWECYARGKNVELREAVFSLVYAFLGIEDFVSGADLFSPIVSLAADSSSEAASALLERFMKLSSEQSCPVERTEYNFTDCQNPSNFHLDDINPDEFPLSSGSTTLKDDLLLILPTTENMWNHATFANIKERLGKINVEPFTKKHQQVEDLKEDIKRDDKQKITISQIASDYVAYLDFMN